MKNTGRSSSRRNRDHARREVAPKEMCLEDMASIWDAMHGMAYGVLGKENVHVSPDEVPTLRSPANERFTSMGTQNIHKNRKKEANGSVDIPGRQLESNMPHMVSAGHV